MTTPSQVKTTRLSDGWNMVEPLTESIARLAYRMLDDDELDELRVVGIDEDGFVEQAKDAEHSAAFFCGQYLMFVVCANWVEIEGKRKRLWDTMSTKTVRDNGLVRAFVAHTPEMLDAFSLGEPTDEYIGICKSDFYRSRKWIEKVCKWEEIGYIGINNVWHTIYGNKKEG